MCLLALLLPGPPGRPRQRGRPHRQAERPGHRPLLRPRPARGRQQAVPRGADTAGRWDAGHTGIRRNDLSKSVKIILT